VLVERIPMLEGRTLYAVAGDWIGWLCAVLVVCGVARARLSKRVRE